MANENDTGASAPTQLKMSNEEFRALFLSLSEDKQDWIIEILEQLTSEKRGVVGDE